MELRQSLWTTLTVAVPGLVIFGWLQIAIAVQGVEHDFLRRLDDSLVLVISVIAAIAVLLQAVGIILERLMIGRWPYRTGSEDDGSLLKLRDQMLASNDPSETAERVVAGFFMSHNVAVGMTIVLGWLVGVAIAESPTWILWVTLPVTAAAWVVPRDRYARAVSVLAGMQQ
ncbi:MAG: hypothetical protein R3246_12520 [Acidimicrobiia bacterium]|nr:hypothetical protein [Acidimicrobiia bacterium]